MIQRLVRLLVQDLELGPVVGKRGKTDGNRNRTGHILIRDERRTYPGQQALGELFSDSAPYNEDELIPADAGSHISIAELFLQDGTKRNRLISVSRWRPVNKVFILNLLTK